MNVEAIIGVNITQFLISFARASGLMVTAPIFQSRNIPMQVKALLAGVLAVTTASYINSDWDLQKFTFWMAIASLIQEVLVGLIIGLMINLTMYAIQLAGYFFDVPIGFGMVNIIDPQSGTEMPIMGHFNYILACLIFLAINGHHAVISAFIRSYELIKPGMFFIKKEAVGVFVQAFLGMFYLGFKIGIPLMGSIFLTDVALGIISKLIPQINVFIIGFPVKIMLGIFVLILFLPTYVFLIEQCFANSGDTFRMLRMMLQNLYIAK